MGRDSDTGGQTKYVVELARALANEPGVSQVDLFTRLVRDPSVSEDYAQATETLGDRARIVRLECGPDEYVRKEELWDYLDSFADSAMHFFTLSGRIPDLVHSHYADAGYVGVRLTHQLGIPLLHTGHSLGRIKRRQLLAAGMADETIEARYHMARRIEAEEDILANAEEVIVSTCNEIEEQYGMYDYYQPERMVVIPPGTDLDRFHPPTAEPADAELRDEVFRFLREPEKPLILALSRPDERKNIATLVRAYGECAALRDKANLLIVAGNRDDIQELDEGPQQVLTSVLLDVDRFDLYGKVAYPKHHRAEQVPEFYRLAAASGGVFINPALTEPFGLTLIEAAASGLPIVATEDGGPQDIIANCRNGYLVDPLDADAMADALIKVLSDRETWQHMVQRGLHGVHLHYSWEAHAKRYLEEVRPLVEEATPLSRGRLTRRPMLYHDRSLFADLDLSLVGDPKALKKFVEFIRAHRKCASFGIATGRPLESALKELKRHKIPQPDVLITGTGTAIHYAPQLTADQAWTNHINHLWNPTAIKRVFRDIAGLERQPKGMQNTFKISYYIDPRVAPGLDELQSLLYQNEQAANLILSFGQFLDVVPVRASKGLALRYFANRFGIPLERILVAGGSGADEDMISGNTLGVVVANRHEEELSQLVDTGDIYFAQGRHAAGILEAIDHYDFFGSCRIPEADGPERAA